MERFFLKIQMLRLKSIKFYVEIKKIFNFKKSELVYYPWITSIVCLCVYIHVYIHINIHSKKITIKAINTIIFNIKEEYSTQISH